MDHGCHKITPLLFVVLVKTKPLYIFYERGYAGYAESIFWLLSLDLVCLFSFLLPRLVFGGMYRVNHYYWPKVWLDIMSFLVTGETIPYICHVGMSYCYRTPKGEVPTSDWKLKILIFRKSCSGDLRVALWRRRRGRARFCLYCFTPT